jgi:hypothetical protein
MTRTKLFAITAGLVASALLAPAALAQVDVPVPDTREQPGKTRVWAGYDHMFNTDINNGGEIQRDSLLLGLSHNFEITEDTSLITNVTYQMDSYDWSKGAKNGGKSGVPSAGFRWSEINTPQLVGLLRTKLNDNWGLFGVGLIRMSAETGANLDDAVTYGGGIGFNWVADDKKLSLGLLTGVLTVIEDDPTFAVLPLVKWQFADAWRFTLEPIYTGAIGYGPELTFSPTDSLELGLGASYQKRRFRLDSHKTVKNGVGQETTAPIFLRCGWKPGDGMLLDLYAGVDVAGHVRTARKGGGKLRGNDYDAAPMLGASFTYKF